MTMRMRIASHRCGEGPGADTENAEVMGSPQDQLFDYFLVVGFAKDEKGGK